MRPTINRGGSRFGRLTAVKQGVRPAGLKSKYAWWWCECDCGYQCVLVNGHELARGKTQSCGCLAKEAQSAPRHTLAGKSFGRLTAIKPTRRDGKHGIFWWCECSCGLLCVCVSTSDLVRGTSRSCGCLAKDLLSYRRGQHRMTDTPEWRAWQSMRGRCLNPSHKAYPYYGGRGIRICSRWDSFEAFLEDMGPRPGHSYSLERSNVNGNYEPGNCVWATSYEQAINKRTSIWIEYDGERLHIKDWAERVDLKYSTLYRRIRDGWSSEKALTTPQKSPAR